MLDLSTIAFLCVASFSAGAMDAIIGGGGLIQLPALLVGLPSVPIATVLGTSKLASVFGTATAAYNYVSHHRPQYRYSLPMVALGFMGSICGALTATHTSTDQLKPIVLFVLLGVWIFTWFRKDFGHTEGTSPSHKKAASIAIVGGGLIGFYDGLIGPGTGAFLLFLLIVGERATFLRASATSKLVNTATNLGALAVFIYYGHVMFLLGLLLAICNIAGSTIGSRIAISKGSKFVRRIFLAVVGALIARLGFDVLFR